jgi:predicted transcriptional regulator
MKRTTVRLDDELMRRAKASAAERGITLTELIEEALRERLARADVVVDDEEWELPAYGEPGEWVNPEVDLDSNASIQEFLDRDLPIEKLR